MATVRSNSGLRIDADEFGALFRELERIDKKVALEIKKRLRGEAAPLVKKMRGAVTDPKSKRSAKIVQVRKQKKTGAAYEVRTNTAELVAGGISFRMETGKNPGVKFMASSSKLPPERKPMTRALNKKKFRHPVFARTTRSSGIRGLFGGRETVWVEQAGRPYFGVVVLDERERLLEAISKAMDEVAENIGKSRIRG
jgi:hypothetical protein